MYLLILTSPHHKRKENKNVFMHIRPSLAQMIIYSSFKKKMQVFLLVDDFLSSPLHFSLFMMIFIPWAAITHLHVSLYDTKGLWGVEDAGYFPFFPEDLLSTHFYLDLCPGLCICWICEISWLSCPHGSSQWETMVGNLTEGAQWDWGVSPPHPLIGLCIGCLYILLEVIAPV